jgi:hypothetical protein
MQMYFRIRGTLPKKYWLALTRPPAKTGPNMTFGEFSWAGSNDTLPRKVSTVSNPTPYTHW